MNIDETYCAIHQIENYPVDCVIHSLNNRIWSQALFLLVTPVLRIC